MFAAKTMLHAIDDMVCKHEWLRKLDPVLAEKWAAKNERFPEGPRLENIQSEEHDRLVEKQEMSVCRSAKTVFR